jgi:hypothetical protein
MQEFIDLKGASGAVYRFALVREGRLLSPMGGNYIYARARGEGYELVHVGEVQNLLKDARARWSQAVDAHGATDLYTRLNITERVRQQEHADILAAMTTPMNPPPKETGRAESAAPGLSPQP